MKTKNENISYQKICKICGNTNLKKVLFINEQYISATFVKTNENNELTKIKKNSNPRYREKVAFNKRNNLDYKERPKK